MAGKIPAGTFNTRFNLDGDQSVKTLRQLKTEVSALTSGWKAQEAQLKSSGDALGAAKTKYEGLSASVKHQEDYISKLRSEQSKLDTSTNKGSEDFAKMEKQIAAATVKLESMSSQQSRAKSSMDYYKSGVAEAQKELTRISETSKSYVTRLQAEGKATQAAKAEASGLGSQYSKMETIYRAQVTELNKIAAASGKSSEAYAKQSVRVNETATKMAQAKTRMGELNSAMKKANPSPFNRIKTALSGVNEKAQKTHSIFKSVFAANIMSNVVSSAWSHLSGWISSATDSAKEYSLAQQTMNATWTTLTGNAKQGKAMVDMTNQMAIAANNATDMVDGMNQKFYSISKNAGTTKSLTQSVLTLQDAFGQSDDAVMNFSTQFSQMMANGKVSAQDMMSFVNVFPVLRTNLLKAEQAATHNSKLTMAQMNDLMSAGKISSATMIKVVQDTAHEYGSATENFGKTIPGMVRTVKSQMPVLLSAITTPLTTAANPIIGTISGWVSSTKTKALFTNVGKTFADGLNNTIKAFSAGGGGNASSLTDKLDAGVEKLNSLISKTFAYLSAHANDIKGIASDTWEIAKIAGAEVWSIAKTTIKDIAGWLGVGGKNAKTMKDPLGTVHDILDKIVKNKSGIQTTVKVLAGLWATKKVFEFAGAVGHVYSGLKSLGESKLGKSIASNLKKLSGSKLGTATAVVTIAYDAVSDIKDLTKAFGKSGTVGQKFKAVGETAGTAIGGGIGFFFGGPLGAAVGASIGKVVGGWAGTATKKFTDGWNAKAKPKDWLGKLGFNAHKGASGIAKWWKGVQAQNNKSNAQMQKQQAAQNKKAKKNWDSFWSGVGKGWNTFWSNYAKKEKKNQADAKKRQDAQNKAISKAMSNFWSSVTKGWSNFWSGIGKRATKGLTNLQKGFTSKLNAIHKGWNNIWSSVGKFFSNILSSIKRTGSSAIGWLGRKIGSGVSAISRGWSRAWHGMSKMFGGIWSGIKSAARTGLNGVIGIINGAIGGINWVWRKFTGHNAIKKIQKLASGGIVGKMQVAMVNDGAGADWKELYRLPNGQFGMMQDRNAIGMFPVGTRVYNGKETKSIMQAAGIQHYAGGGIIGAVGNFFKSGWDKVTAIGDWLKHPIANMTKAVESAVSGMTASTSMFTSLGKGVVSKMVSGVSAWAQKQLKKLEDTLSPAEPSGSGVQRWKPDVLKALEKLNLSTSAAMVAKVLTQIKTESGGNAKAMGGTDGLSDGHAEGLMQVKPGTFAAYSLKGHGNIWNGYDNMLAGLNYAKHRYGSSLSFLGHGHGYANGGFANTASIFGEDGLEAAIPLSSLKSSRGYEMLGKTAAAMAARDNVGASNGSGDVSAKLDKLITLMTTLVNDGVNETIEAHFHAYLDKHEMTKEMVEPITIEQNRRNRATARQKGKITWS